MKIFVEERKGRTGWRTVRWCFLRKPARRYPNKDRKEVRERAICKSGEKHAR